MPKLVFFGGPGPEQEYLVGPTETVVGRNPGLDIVVQHDSMSRQHARLDRYGDRYYLSDLGSTNGTFLNGKRIKRGVLSEGDEVTFGELRFRFSHEDPSSPASRWNPLKGISRVLEQLSDQGGGEATEVPETEGASPPMEGAFQGILEKLRQKSARWESAYRQLTVLYRIANVLNGYDGIDRKLATSVKLAIATLKAERGFLFEYCKATDELESRVAFARSEDGTTHLDWVRAVARRAVDSDEPLASGPGFSLGAALTRPPSGRVFVVAPLRTQRGSYGSLYLDAPSQDAAWGREEVEFVSTLAGQIGATLDHEHYAQQMIAKSEVERELSIARTIQSGLLPETLPGVSGVRAVGRSRASKEVGGDYFDVVLDREGRLYGVVADVSGKGVPAALVQAQVRSQVRALGKQGRPPELLLTDVSDSLMEDYEGAMYVTIFLGVVEPGASKLRYVNAGHVWPARLVASERRVEYLEEGGHPCGLFPDTSFEVHEVDFRPGDKLLVASDGIADAENVQGEHFGNERFAALLPRCHDLSGPEVVDVVFGAIDEWGKEAPQFDDATLLVLEAEGDGDGGSGGAEDAGGG